MKDPNDLNAYFNKYKQDQSIATKSRSWYQQQTTMMNMRRLQERKLFREQRLVNRIFPGKLYMFYYDPKYKETLPHYDRFPLVFPYKRMSTGFMGLNMHYLPYFHRVQLMTRLMQFANNQKFNEATKIKYSWNMIEGMAKFKTAKHCIKHYLSEHVESQFIEIPGSDWHTAMMLPVERFVGATKSTVWSESIKI